MLAGAGHLTKVYDALMAEAVACWKALETAVNHGISRVILETDSLLLQKAVPSGIIFKDVRSLVREHFIQFDCFHASRLCNSSAHEVAALGLNQIPGWEETWEYPIPLLVTSHIARVSAGLEVN